MAERWRPVVGFEGLYEVSSAGRVRNSKRKGRLLTGWVNGRGYQLVSLTHRCGIARTYPVHVLVAIAFFGPRPKGHVIDHLNGIKTDNRVWNIQFVTPAVNARRAAKLGLLRGGFKKGEKNFNSKLTEAQVVEMRALRRSGMRLCEVARHFGVRDNLVFNVVTRRTWKHVA